MIKKIGLIFDIVSCICWILLAIQLIFHISFF